MEGGQNSGDDTGSVFTRRRHPRGRPDHARVSPRHRHRSWQRSIQNRRHTHSQITRWPPPTTSRHAAQCPVRTPRPWTQLTIGLKHHKWRSDTASMRADSGRTGPFVRQNRFVRVRRLSVQNYSRLADLDIECPSSCDRAPAHRDAHAPLVPPHDPVAGALASAGGDVTYPGRPNRPLRGQVPDRATRS